MRYLAALRRVHRIIRPKNYVEIGCREGTSLALARARTVAVDPDFAITQELAAPTRLFRMTSDEFFVRKNVHQLLRGPVDFAFIDGMHLVEFALRDFLNLERASHPLGLIAVDDVLPAEFSYVPREPKPLEGWTGDVYRLIPLLRHYRPDLDIRVYDIAIQGFCLVTNLDSSSTVLSERYPEIEAEIVAGRWALTSAEAIRSAIGPLPVESLQADLEEFAARREAEGRAPAR